MMITATKQDISNWESENGESFFDYNEMCVSVKDFLNYAEEHYPQFVERYKESFKSGVDTLVDLLELMYEDESAYEASLDIVIALVNNNEEYNSDFWDFINDVDDEV